MSCKVHAQSAVYACIVHCPFISANLVLDAWRQGTVAGFAASLRVGLSCLASKLPKLWFVHTAAILARCVAGLAIWRRLYSLIHPLLGMSPANDSHLLGYQGCHLYNICWSQERFSVAPGSTAVLLCNLSFIKCNLPGLSENVMGREKTLQAVAGKTLCACADLMGNFINTCPEG